MPAASYREGPDGHSSRKQNSKRRRAKCSPSFVSGRVIGHGDISPRCISECSAMALHRAVPAACPSRASTLSFVLLAGRRSPSPAFGAVFLRGGRQLFGTGRIQASVHGKIFANAFSGDWQWQYTRAVRPQVPCRGKISPRCVPGRQSVAIFSPHVSQKWPRTGKSPVRDKIRAPCIRKALQTAVWGYTARRSCHEGAAFAARTPRIMHGAQILPSAVAPNRPSARNPGAAEKREPPELDLPAQETQSGGSAPVASWAASTASSSLGTATALCQHQPVACRPANNSVIADSVTCGDSIHAAPAPPIRRAALAQREGYLPYLWRLSSVFLADAIGL